MDERADAKETARTEGFSDGVFSIAITLLILDLTGPRIHGGRAAYPFKPVESADRATGSDLPRPT